MIVVSSADEVAVGRLGRSRMCVVIGEGCGTARGVAARAIEDLAASRAESRVWSATLAIINDIITDIDKIMLIIVKMSIINSE